MPGKPVVAWFIIGVAMLTLVINALRISAVVMNIGLNPLSESVGTAVVSVLVAAFSGWIAYGLMDRKLKSRAQVSLYLWTMLLIYPMYNVLRALGLYLPAPEMAPEELPGAVLVELLRYLVFLVLIVWVGFSEAARKYCAAVVADERRH